MDRENLKSYIANRLLKLYAKKYKDDEVWAWDKVKEATLESTVAEKKEILRALESTSFVRKILNTEALSEAELMVQDDSLDLAELSRILESK